MTTYSQLMFCLGCLAGLLIPGIVSTLVILRMAANAVPEPQAEIELDEAPYRLRSNGKNAAFGRPLTDREMLDLLNAGRYKR